MKGTLRYNIDPLSKHNDEEILNVIESIGIDYLHKNSNKGINMLVIKYLN